MTLRRGAIFITRSLLAATITFVLVGTVFWILSGPSDGARRLIVSPFFLEGSGGTAVAVTWNLWTIGVATVGAVISSRVSRNPIGWILTGLGLWTSLTFFLSTFLVYLAATDPSRTGLGALAGWLGNWTFVPMVTIPITYILMLVPNGRLPSHRWGILPWLAAIGIAGWSVAQMFEAHLGFESALIPNPFFDPTVNGVANILSLLLVVAFVGAVASIVMRFRGAGETERHQIKWVAFGGAIQVMITLGLSLLSVARPLRFGAIAITAGNGASLITPIALAVAILKYRLFDIDRLISRAVAYALMVGGMALMYASVTIGLPQFLRLPTDSSLMVAAATLIAAGLFRPLSRRLQALVDRRFNRSRYDAQREIDLFISKLVRTVDLDHVISETSATLRRTVQPDEVGVWIRRTT